MEKASIHNTNMVRNVVAGLQEALQQKQSPTDNGTTILKPIDHVENSVQNTQQQLAMQLQHMQVMIQAMQMQYSAAPQLSHQDYEVHRYHGGYNNYRCRRGSGTQHRVNWRSGQSGRGNSDLTHYCWNHRMCAHPSKYCRPLQKATRRTWCGVTRCWGASGTAPDRSG